MFTLIKGAFINAGITLFSCAAFAQQLPATEIRFHIEPQPLRDALNLWAQQAGLQLGWSATSEASQRMVSPVMGGMTPQVALEALLGGTGFTYSVVDERTVRIRPQASIPRAQPMAKGSQGVKPGRKSTGLKGPAPTTADSSKNTMPTEVVVTGTHIRGMTNPAVPVTVFEPEDFARYGVGTVQDFVAKWPQYFGSASDATAGGTGGAASLNSVGASGMDLRGLGLSSTLVVINGRRFAPGNIVGNFVDISLIPLSAVDKIEMVTDGASSIYGADAVAGVVNFILRKDFAGAETRGRYGAVDHGRRYEVTASQTLGERWNSGHGLITYEYLKSTPLGAEERSYSQWAARPLTLVPGQTRHGAFATVEQNISPAMQIFIEGIYSERSMLSANSTDDPALSFVSSANVRGRSGTIGLRHVLPRDSQLEVSGGYTQTEGRLRQHRTVPDTGLHSDVEALTGIGSINVNVDGMLWSAGAGSAKYAVGAQFRSEHYRSHNLLTNLGFEPARSLHAAYLELQIPVIGPESARLLAEKFELNLASRYEESDDFGSSNNPKIGFLWDVTQDLSVRGTYGTSFKAPLLADLNPAPAQVVPLSMPDPSAGARTNTLIIFGGNPDLGPEKAVTWTLGVDMSFEKFPNLKASATYYNIRLTDRILAPQTKVDIFDSLQLEHILGPTIVQRNVPQSAIQQLASARGFVDTGIDLQTIHTLIDNRSQNLATLDTTGVDLKISYECQLSRGWLTLGVDATRILNFDSQFNAIAKNVGILNTPYNPISFRARSYASFSAEPVTFSIFLNHTDGYKDNRKADLRPIASWTTADAVGSYELGSGPGILEHMSMTFGIMNVLAKKPPFVDNPDYRVNYDATNANGMGRVYSLQLTKTF